MSTLVPKLPPDIEIARAAKMLPIREIAAKLNIGEDDLEYYGRSKAKVSLDLYHRLDDAPTGKLVLVTAITPTPAGEGKTTTCIGLADGLNRIGKRATVCLREPSMGPCFGMKGGAAGGGYSQVVPMEDSTSISPATGTPSAWLITSWPTCSTTTSIRATRWGSTRGGSPGAG